MKLGALGALVALALLVVMIGPSEGRRLSMCDLKAELQKQAPRDWGTFTIARVICQADALSGLNTTLVRCPPPKVTTPSPVANATAAAATKTTVTPTRTARIIYLTTVPQRPDTTPSNDDDGSSEEEAEGGKGSTRPVGGRCPPGTSYYGIFQLSDRIFCDSGRKPTRNLCRTPCSAFSDDDPTDDIRCIIQTGYWRHLYNREPHQCRNNWSILKLLQKLHWCR